MAESDRAVAAFKLAGALARARNESEATACVARAAGALAAAEVVRVWMIDHELGYRFAGSWPDEAAAPGKIPAEIPRAVAFGAPSAGAATAPFRSRLTVPLMIGSRPIGAVEMLERSRPAGAFTPADAHSLKDLVEAADAGLHAVRERASREERQVAAVARLTRLFDIGRSFASTLEIGELSRVIVNRAQAALEAENAYLWILDADSKRLTLTAAAGPAAEAVTGWELEAGSGVGGFVAASGARFVTNDPDEIPDGIDRPETRAGIPIRCVAAAPIAGEDERILGVLELVNKERALDFEDDDLAVLMEVAGTAAVAIGNARRLDAERRASDLGALLTTTRELGLSLDTRKIAFTLVHQTAAIIRYRRASVGLLKGARLELAAVSGQSVVDETIPEIRTLRDILQWASGLDEGTYIVQEEDGNIDTDRAETREKFSAYFAASGTRSFLAIPLRDEEGRIGVFALEASESYAFSARDLEAAGLLAAQANVVIRNATLFQQIPAFRLFQPLARGQRWFTGLSRGRRLALVAGALVVLGFMLIARVPLRVAGDARVLPALKLPVTAEVAGRIADVYVREGDHVEPGQVLAALSDADYRLGEEDARLRYETATLEQSRFRAEGRAAEAAVEAARADGLKAELDLWRRRVAETRIRATTAGIVATPRVEEMLGIGLRRGDVFCEVIDPSRPSIEISVPEEEAGLVSAGMPVKVKLHAFPTSTLRARIESVGVAATVEEGRRFFLARAGLEGVAEPLRSGMTGGARIDTGAAPIVRVVLRRPARWAWTLIWGWLP